MIRRDARWRQLIEKRQRIRRHDSRRLGQIGNDHFACRDERTSPLTAWVIARLLAVRRRARIGRMVIARMVSVLIVMGAMICDRQLTGVSRQVCVMCAAAHDNMSRQDAGGNDRHDLPGKTHSSHILSVSKYRPHFGMGQVKLCGAAVLSA
jgi:hypothetical protein